jgi:hypothetical protein
MSEWAFTVTEFTVGSKVWPTADSALILQNAPQTVIATASHPKFGLWLWLADDATGVRSSHAASWTTEEPDAEEQKRRFIARAAQAQDDWNVRKYTPVPVDVPTGWKCPSCATFWSPQVEKCGTCVPPHGIIRVPLHNYSHVAGFTTCPAPLRGGLCGCE